MEKTDVYRQLNNSQIGSLLTIQWDRRNGPLESKVRFTGFDENFPILYLECGTRLDIEKIGGYNAIISLQPVIE